MIKRLFLIDGHSMFYRAYFAIPPLSTSYGMPTNAIFGFTNMLLKLLREGKPTHIAVTADSKIPTFRHKLFSEYKITRPSMPDDLREQMKLLPKLLDAFNIPLVFVDGYEADDVIATIVKKEYKNFDEIFIVSADKDIMQLINDKVKLLAPLRGVGEVKLYDKEEVTKKFGIASPPQIKDLLVLIGDTSDNLPGIEGIGEKQARVLLNKFHSIENLLASVETLPKKERERILPYKEQILLNKKLVSLEDNLPLELTSLELKELDRGKLSQVFKELEFYSILEKLELYKEETCSYKLIKSIDELTELLDKFEYFSFVLHIKDKFELLGISIAGNDGRVYYHPFKDGNQKEIKEAKRKILSYIISTNKECYTWILKEFYIVSLKEGIEFSLDSRDFPFDSSIAAHLVSGGSNLTLQDLAKRYLGSTFKVKDDIEEVCAQALIIIQVSKILQEELREKELQEVYFKIELPLSRVLAAMEYHGVTISYKKLEKLRLELQHRLDEIEREIYNLAGLEFNLNSPKQLAFVLFEKLQLPPQKKIKTGYSTDEEVLNKLQDISPVVKKILEYRELSKLLSTYIASLEPSSSAKDKDYKVHTTFHQTTTQTGRLSSSNPNLQNIPTKTELAKKIRELFIPTPGYIFISFDYSQIELRILADRSQDSQLKEAFLEDRDIHRQTAVALFGEVEVTEELRRIAKSVNFGIVYGISPFGLAKQANLSQRDAEQMIKEYFEKYPKVKDYINSTIEFAKKNGYVLTLNKRRRYLPDITSSNRNLREAAERMAINTPIQGSAAELIKLAMIEIYRKIAPTDARILIQVHDELLMEVKEEKVDELVPRIRGIMENVLPLSVPLKVDVSLGNNWGEC